MLVFTVYFMYFITKNFVVSSPLLVVIRDSLSSVFPHVSLTRSNDVPLLKVRL